MSESVSERLYWKKNLRITSILLVAWFMVTFVLAYFARDLNFNFFGWPFSFYMAAQGSLLIYLLIVGIYAWTMRRLDLEHGVDDDA
jgi:putative solute:sodium symporter small subunit